MTLAEGGGGATRRQVGVGMAFTAAVLLGIILLQAWNFEASRFYDFATRYASGLIVLQGNGAKLYDVEEETRVQRALFGRATPLVELHPPFEALIYAPLAEFSYRRAYVIWGVINIGLWMFTARLLRPDAPVPRQTFRYLILCFAFFPLWMALLGGQTSILLLVSYSLTFVNLKRRRDFAAGVFLGLGLIKFQLVLAFALICALRRRWRMMAGFALSGAILTAVSAMVVGPAGLLAYARLLLYTTRHPADPAFSPIPVWAMPTVRGCLSALAAGKLPPLWLNAGVGIISVLLIWFTARRWRREEERCGDASLNLMFALSLVVSLVTGFYMFSNDMSAMLPAILLAVGAIPWPEKSAWGNLLMGATITLYLPFVYLLLNEWHLLYLVFFVLAAFLLGIIGIQSHLRHPGKLSV